MGFFGAQTRQQQKQLVGMQERQWGSHKETTCFVPLTLVENRTCWVDHRSSLVPKICLESQEEVHGSEVLEGDSFLESISFGQCGAGTAAGSELGRW